MEPAFALNEAEFKSKYGVPKPKVTDDNIIFFCKSGKRGLAACKSVEKYGYKKYELFTFAAFGGTISRSKVQDLITYSHYLFLGKSVFHFMPSIIIDILKGA